MTGTAEIEKLIAQVALANHEAFRSLYDRTSAKLFGVCLRVLKDRAEAEEVLQDVFVTIWQKADHYAVNGLSPMSWLITIARNRAIDRLRAHQRRGEPIGGDPEVEHLRDVHPGPESAAIARSEQGRIIACLEELEEDHARAVRRAYLDGHTYRELAAHFDVPLNTMRTWLRRSLMKLRECLSR